MTNKEREELEALGLEVSEDLDDLTDEALELKASEKKKDYKALPTLKKREAKNIDEPENKITPDELKLRLLDQETRESKLVERRQRLIEEDREHQTKKWNALIPVSFAHTDVQKLPTELSTVCTDWLLLDRIKQRNIIFLGSAGRGKTFTAYAIAKELFIGRQKIMLTEATELLDSLRPNAIEPRELNDVKKVPYLLIDDLGTEKISEWVLEQWFQIFDNRWKHALPTILTMNLLPKVIAEKYGERISTRIFNDASIIEITGPNRRTP